MFKKTFLILLTIFFVGSQICLASDEPTEQKNIILVNPIGLIFGVLGAEYILKLSDQNSLGIAGEYWRWTLGDFKASAIGLGGGYYFHFKPTSLRGWYAGPTAYVLFWSAENTYLELKWNGSYYEWVSKTEKATSTWFSIGGVIGYRWVFESNWVIDVNTGIHYMIGNLEIGGTKLGLSGFGWGGIGGGVGYAF